jgi:hypothetical protein
MAVYNLEEVRAWQAYEKALALVEAWLAYDRALEAVEELLRG